MAEGGYPNKNRAINAYDAYGDAMRPYVVRVLEDTYGPDWIQLRLLSDKLREKNRRHYDDIQEALRSKRPLVEMVDRADIPDLVGGDQKHFPDLKDASGNLFTIRRLRNEIVHSGRPGDCTIEEANAIIGLCVLTLERCGLSDVAENIRGLSLETAVSAAGVSEAELREQRERREWDKKRLRGKSLEDLTSWDQQRLEEIEWEEEQERRELERGEIAQFGDDIDGLRLWFNADEARHDRHPPEYAALLQREQERYGRERAEIAAFGDDLDSLRRWFDADGARRDRHPAEHATLPQREQARRDRQSSLSGIGWAEQARREREQKQQRERELQEREQAEIAAFDDNINGLRRWFNEDLNRAPRHPSIWATLRKEEQSRERDEREELARLAGDVDRLRDWFDADSGRPQRHKPAHEDLLSRERELHEEERADEPSAPAKRSLRSRIFRRR